MVIRGRITILFSSEFLFGARAFGRRRSDAFSLPMRPWRPQFRSAGAVRAKPTCKPTRPVSSWRNSTPQQLPAIAFAKADDDDGDDDRDGEGGQEAQPPLPPPPPPKPKIETRGAKPGRFVSDETRSKMSRAKEGRVMPLGALGFSVSLFLFFLFLPLSLLFFLSLTAKKPKHKIKKTFKQKPASRSPCPERAPSSPARPRSAWPRCAAGGGRARGRRGSSP